MPHPATMFFLLTLGIIFLSWIFDVYGLNVRLPQTGEEIRVQSLLSPEGIRWLLRHVVTNFTGFAPLGLVIVAMFGIGVAQHSGFIDACIRKGLRNQRHNPWRIVLSVIVLGLLSNVVGDAGYIILLPIAATLFHSVGLHPIGGIIVAYVSVSCGYSANILLSTLDPMLAATTQEAADMTNHPVASLRCGGHSGKTWAVGANLPPAVVCQHRIYAETVYHEHTDARGRAAAVGISRRKGKGCGIQVRLRRDKPVLKGIQEMERVRPVGIPQAKTDRGK